MSTLTFSTPLLRERDFLRLWTAQTVSDFGARTVREGLPIMAVLTLSAGPRALGSLAAVAGAAALVVSLASGGFVDGRRRRPLMITMDLLRAAVLATLPVAAWLHVLSFVQVLVVAGVTAGLSTLFDIANHAFLPTLVKRDQLTEANARISATEGLAEMGGPAVAGVLFQWLTAPVAVVLTSVTYLASALALGRIESPEPPAPPAHKDRRVWNGLRIGASLSMGHPIARVLVFTGTIGGLFGGVFSALYILFALRTLGLPTAVLGLGVAFGGLAALAGSFATPWFANRFGVGRTIIWTSVLSALGTLVIVLAPADRAGATVCLFVQQFLGDFFGVAPYILGGSLIQSVFEPRVLGRVNAFFRACRGLAAIVGALAGGALAAVVGPREAMLWAIGGLMIGPLVAAFTPLNRVRKMPSLYEMPATA